MASVDSSLTVLLVEDNPNDAMLIRRHLEGSDSAFLPDEVVLYHEKTLSDGFDRLAEEPIELLLLDLGLPETDGKETFEAVREYGETVPVVVLTNLRDEQLAVDLLQQGAQDYINKGSLSEEQLVKSVRYALERQEQKQRLRATTERLEVLNRILRHDIQNDVQVLQLWSEGLRERVDQEHAEDLQRLVETSEHIKELTENSREYLETVTGESDPDTEPIRVDRVLDEELEKAQSTYTDATFERGSEFPAQTVSANEMLSSVFRNLLANAVLHNDSDDPRVVADVDADGDTVTVTVADNGPGIPDDQRETVFGKGEQGLESSGTGIGLYLVHTLVTGFGGEVTVADGTDDLPGAHFVVELPAAEAESWAGS